MLGGAKERDFASSRMSGWLGIDNLAALLTPGRRHVAIQSRQILDDFVNQETRKHLNDFSFLVLLPLRHSIEAPCSLSLCLTWLDTGLQGSNAQAIVCCNCCR